MSSKKASITPYKPGQSAKKASVSSAAPVAAGKRLTLAQQIAEMTNVAPKDFDPEDESGLNATVSSFDADADAFAAPTVLSSERNMRKAFDVDDVSAEYKGKVVSRKSLQADDEDSDHQDEEGDDLEDDEEVDEESAGEDDDAQMDGMDDDEDGEDDEDQSDADGSDADHESGTANMLSSALSAQQKSVASTLAALEAEDDAPGVLFKARGSAASTATAPSASSQYNKSMAMRRQQDFHASLLNVRIRMQSCLTAANRLPPVSVAEEPVLERFQAEDEAVAPAYDGALGEAQKLLKELLDLQSSMMERNSALFAREDAEDDEGASSIPRFVPGGKRKRDDDDDEDTEAASDDGASVDAVCDYLTVALPAFFRPVQDALIERWNQRTQQGAGVVAPLGNKDGSSAGFKVINQSVLAQIDNIMLDQPRLIRRAQLHRGGEELLGRKRAKIAPKAVDDVDGLLAERFEEVYDDHIYDDADYYQQLLAEIIAASSSAGASDATLRSSASAARRKTRKGGGLVDRRASKGRKMRYTVHAKLANFMAPKPAPISSEFDKSDANGGTMSGSGFAMDELFMNLFGGQAKP